MKTKESQPMMVLSYETKATLANLQKYVGSKPDELAKELNRQGIEATGPLLWIYRGTNGDPHKKFTLEITIPVNKTGKDNKHFRFKQIPGFRYVSHTHCGPWSEFKQVYEKFIGTIRQEGLQITDQCREIYIHSDFENPENCITEIQMGIN